MPPGRRGPEFVFRSPPAETRDQATAPGLNRASARRVVMSGTDTGTSRADGREVVRVPTRRWMIAGLVAVAVVVIVLVIVYSGSGSGGGGVGGY